MNLFSLDKKRITVQSRHESTHLEEVMKKHTITKDDLQQEIQKDLYQKMLPHLAKELKTKFTPLPNGQEQYEVTGYILNDVTTYNLIREILEMDKATKVKWLQIITKALGAEYYPDVEDEPEQPLTPEE